MLLTVLFVVCVSSFEASFFLRITATTINTTNNTPVIIAIILAAPPILGIVLSIMLIIALSTAEPVVNISAKRSATTLQSKLNTTIEIVTSKHEIPMFLTALFISFLYTRI